MQARLLLKLVNSTGNDRSLEFNRRKNYITTVQAKFQTRNVLSQLRLQSCYSDQLLKLLRVFLNSVPFLRFYNLIEDYFDKTCFHIIEIYILNQPFHGLSKIILQFEIFSLTFLFVIDLVDQSEVNCLILTLLHSPCKVVKRSALNGRV